MRLSLKGGWISGFRMSALGAEIGTIKEAYFDDQQRAIRYLIVKTGNRLNGGLTLISPQALLPPNWDNELFPMYLNIERIGNGPTLTLVSPYTISISIFP